jgi:serine/threonine protein kinase/tetratricopeptide (TPR) repeat protein
MSACATIDQLQRLVDDLSEHQERETVATHLQGCAVCREILQRLPRRPRASSARGAAPSDSEGETCLLDDVDAKNPPHVEHGLARHDSSESDEKSLPAQRSTTAAPHVDRASLAVPSQPSIAGFRIIREIGRGGMGVVYEAEETRLSRRVALKILSGNAIFDPNQIRRFEREAKAAGRLHHTNIVPVFGVGQQGDRAYCVMQYIEGSGLDAVLAELRRQIQDGSSSRRPQAGSHIDETPRTMTLAGSEKRAPTPIDPAGVAMSLVTGTFAAPERPAAQAAPGEAGAGEAGPPPAESFAASPQTVPSSLIVPGPSGFSSSTDLNRPYFKAVAQIGIQVAEALAYANRQGVLHRDIKPSNLLLDRKGNVWVADFGLAKTTEAEDMTQTGQLVGTVRYMAPERFGGQCDARSDLYGLGLTLYELVALRPAHEGTDRFEVMEKIRREEPTRLKLLAPRVPRDLETIIHKAIAVDPGQRYPAAAALADDLRRFVQDQPIKARRASSPERVARWCRRNPWVAAFLVALSLGVIGSTWEAVRANFAHREARLAETLARNERDRAESEAAIAKAVNEFLNKDVLAQASANNQATPNTRPDPDLKVRTALDRAAGKIGQKFQKQPLVEATIRHTIGQSYQQLGLYPLARPHFERELELRRSVLGKNHPETFAALSDLGGLYLADDKMTEAGSYLVAALQGLRQTRGAVHPETLAVMSAVAQVYRSTEKLADAEALLLEAGAGFRTAGLGESPEAVGALNDLGMVYLDENKLGPAEETINRVVDIFKRTHGFDHPSTLSAIGNLGLVYDSRGLPEKAERTFVEVLKKQREVLGSKHPDTLMSMINLGNHYVYHAEPAKAEQLLLEALQGCRTALDGRHIMTNAALSILSALYAKAGDLKKLGPVLIEARDVTRARWGPDSGLTAGANQAAAALLLFQKDYAKAEPYLREILDFRIKNEPESWARFKDEGCYGACLLDQKKYAEAAAALISAYEGMKARENDAPEQERTLVTSSLDRIIRLYEAWGKTDEAEKWRKKKPSPPAAAPPKS